MPTIQLPPDMPRPMRQLPRDEVGRPIPWFVADGDFRVVDARKIVRAVRERLCFLCGQPLRRASSTFVAGPMCLVNRVSAEPPNHFDCALWSTLACPFLTRPLRERRDADLPDDVHSAGVMIERNPGVTALIQAPEWGWFRVGDDVLFRFRPELVTWMAMGRTATTDEVLDAIDSGVPLLVNACEEEGDEEHQVRAMRALAGHLDAALEFVPGRFRRDPTDFPNIACLLLARS